MNSRLYNGFVEHERLLPTAHNFQYAVYFYALDLDELDALGHRIPLFGYNKLRPSAIHDKDYLDGKSGSIKEKLMGRLREQSIVDATSIEGAAWRDVGIPQWKSL